MKTKFTTLGKGHEYLGHFRGEQILRAGHNKTPWPKDAAAGQAEDAVPKRSMLINKPATDEVPERAGKTRIPNVYRGKLQPEGALPEQSPAAYSDWQTKI